MTARSVARAASSAPWRAAARNEPSVAGNWRGSSTGGAPDDVPAWRVACGDVETGREGGLQTRHETTTNARVAAMSVVVPAIRVKST